MLTKGAFCMSNDSGDFRKKQTDEFSECHKQLPKMYQLLDDYVPTVLN